MTAPDAATCLCVSLMDTSKCPVHGGTSAAPDAPRPAACLCGLVEGECPAHSFSPRPAGEDVEALRALLAALRYGSHTFTTHEMAERILASDWLAAHDAQVAAAAEVAAGERIAKAIEAARGRTYNNVGFEALTTAARIAHADRGSDRG